MPVSDLKILYIDNDAAFVTALLDKLAKGDKNYSIEVIDSIDLAIERLKQGKVDIVILNLNDDFEENYQNFLRIHQSFADLSIIVLTKNYDNDLAYKLIQSGAQDYLYKQLDDNFINALHIALARSCWIRQCYRLANFSEWNTHPIIELNTKGEVIYLNLTARGQFPDLLTKGLDHPLLQGLQKLIFDFLPRLHSEITIFNREISFSEKNYEQQLFILPNSGVYIYVIDITERNQLRAQALLNDRLATVGTLAAGVAHEINNPIAWVLENLRFLKDHVYTIKGYITEINQIIQESNIQLRIKYFDRFISNIHTKQQETIYQFDEIIDETLQGAERIRDIVRDLKGFARVDKTEVSAVDVNAVLNTAISMAVPEFKYRARLEKKLTANLPPLLVNSGKLHQVFLNLIVNAAQSIPEGDIQNNKIGVTTDLEDDKIRIDISDTGLGIPSDVLPRIFDPFFTTKTAGSGTGLGLAIVHEVISKFGGDIKVNTELNKGTTFTVTLPAHFELDYKQTKGEQAPTSKSGKKQVLIIDDERSLLKTMERMLQSHHNVITILGGEAALELLKKSCNIFDIIICDLNMPNVNGADLHQYVAKNCPGKENRFIFISAGVYTHAMNTFLANIRNPLVEKPFTAKDLLQAIDNLVLKSEKTP